jgi:hypothetical protein
LGLYITIDRFPQKLLIGLNAPLRADGSLSVEHKLHGIEDCGLAATINAAKEDDRHVPSVFSIGGEVKCSLTFVNAEISERQLIQDHS